jgi:aubergine-like protein
LELISKRKFDGSDVKIKFALVGEFQQEDATYTSVSYFPYEVNIKDDRQFLLVSRPSRNKPDNQQGASMRDDTIYLIPELCGMTGLTEEHRSGFWFNYF